MENNYNGPERRTNPHIRHHNGRRAGDKIHPYRWTLLTLWIIGFTVIVLYSIHKVINDSVKVQSLQHTNCRLTLFLLTARKTRWDQYAKTHHNIDLQAVVGYERLVSPFTLDRKSIDGCKIPARLLIKGRPLPGRNS